MDYGKLLSRGWEIVWNFKFLFFLGLLSACGGNSLSGGPNFNFSFPSNFGGGSSTSPTPFPGEVEQFFGELERFFEQGGPLPTVFETAATLVVVGICGLFLFFLIFFVIRQIAEAGLISATNAIDNGQKVDFRTAFNAGYQHWLSFLGQIIILALPQLLLFTLFGVIGLVIFTSATSSSNPNVVVEDLIPIGITFLVCTICLIVPYSLFTSLLRPLGQRAVVLQDMGAWAGLKHGWSVLRENTLDVFLLALIYVVLGFLVGIVLGIVGAAVLLATVAPIFFSLIGGGEIGGVQIGAAVVGFVIITIFGLIVNGLGVTYRSVTFTLAYMHFTGLPGSTTLDTSAKGDF